MEMYELDFSHPMGDSMEEWEALNDKAIAIVGDHPHSAGTGFGSRDMQWDFETREKAEAARSALQIAFPKAECCRVRSKG
jgi:hypothetical protein